MNSPHEFRDLAISIARDAATMISSRRAELSDPHYRLQTGSVTSKSTPTDPVTIVDTETESFIRARLVQARPDDAVLGEEQGGTSQTPQGVRWVIDPIDGTVNFLYGIPAYSVSIAAQVDGMSVAGVVVDVVAGTTYSATKGGGAFRDDGSGPRALHASATSLTQLSLVATGFGYSALRRRQQGEFIAALLPQVRDIRRIGSAALDLCMVASGAVDAHIEHGLNPWDWAAGALIAAEAGAEVRVPDPSSRSADGVPTLAAAPGIAEEFIELVSSIGGLEPMCEHIDGSDRSQST